MQTAVADRWERLAPISGILFSVLVAVLFLVGQQDVLNLSAEELTARYREIGQVEMGLQYLAMGFASIALIWFGGSLRAYLGRSEGGPGRLSVIVFGSAVAGAALLAAANAIFLGAPSAAVFTQREGFLVDPAVDEIVGSVGYLVFSYALLAIGAMFGATAIAGLRTRSLPAWFSWVSLLVALVLAANVFFFVGFFLLLVWPIVTAIVLMTRLRGPGAGSQQGAAA